MTQAVKPSDRVRIRVGAPLIFRVVRSMSRAHMRGAGVLTRLLQRLGVLDVVAEYELHGGRFAVPLWRITWDSKDLKDYEAAFVREFARALTPLQRATFLDCGADIGTFAALLCSQTDRISHIIAVEPNSEAAEYLKVNLDHLGIPYRLLLQALSSFCGHGRLDRPDYDSSDHARFLHAGAGPIEVTTIDSLDIAGGDVAIKLDLEGGELEALKGARKTLAGARHCVVGFEASPAVKSRTGRDPVECLEFLKSVRPFEFVVAETGERPSISAPLLKNGQTQIWNIVGSSYRVLR